MSPLEIRLILYAALALGLMGGSAWASHVITSHHYERVIALNKLAMDQAIQTQQVKVIADLEAQQAATRAAEKQYVDLKASYDGLSGKLSDSLRAYAELRRSLLPATPAATARTDAAAEGAQRDSELATLAGQATEACLGDAATLTALQAWAKP